MGSRRCRFPPLRRAKPRTANTMSLEGVGIASYPKTATGHKKHQTLSLPPIDRNINCLPQLWCCRRGRYPMETTRIKIRIGEHEFDAEGPVETVQSQFEAFKEIISGLASQAAIKQAADVYKVNNKKTLSPPTEHVELEKIVHVSGRIVSLTALPVSTEDAALIIMLGHKDMRNHVSVTGQEIGDGLAQSGRPVPRVDRLLDKAIGQALILKSGIKRSTRYRLTNQGQAKALLIANEL